MTPPEAPGGDLAAAFVQRIERKTAAIGVIGMGYVGLPLARAFTDKGYKVVGFDIDKSKVESLNAGRSYIRHIPAEKIAGMIKLGLFSATNDFTRLAEVHAIIICVPTPLTANREPDMSYIEKTAEEIRPNLQRGQLVVLESTTYPGTTDEVVRPILEKSGLRAGHDFFLAFSPEREDPGNPKYSTEKIPKVVGGCDPKSGDLAKRLYSRVVAQVVPVSSAAAAEATKLLENIYRSVNIALVNELKVLFNRMGLDVWEIIEAASTKPFGFQPFTPGPGLGGHCIPIDPFYLTWKARQYGFTTRFIELAGEINTSMPHYVIERVTEALNERSRALKGSKILILGIAYKKDVDDMRESPALHVMELLQERGAAIAYHDPFVPQIPRLREFHFTLSSVPLTAETLKAQDCVVITTDHTNVDYALVAEHAPLVIDTRNATKKLTQHREKIVKA